MKAVNSTSMISATNKLVLAVVVLTILALTIAVVVTLPTVGAKKHSNSSSDFATYSNSDFHFSINYPALWTKEETNLHPNQIVQFYTTGPPLAGFTISTFQVPQNYTLADYVNEPNGGSIQVIDTKPKITLPSGLDAYQTTYYDNSKTHNIKDLDTAFIRNGTVYLLEYRTEPGGFDTNLPIAKQMINSFQLTN
jgi:hypothetical protein